MNLVERIEAPAEAFDYDQLDDATALEAKSVVERYRARTETYMFDTGRDLLAIKGRLDHGQFLEWLKAELRLTPRSAQRFMSVSEVLGSKSDTVSYLPPTVLYKLAAPTTPQAAREEIVGRIEAGEALSPREVTDRLWEADQVAKREAAQAKLTPEERKRQAKSKRDAETRRQRDLERWRQEQAEKGARSAAAVKQVAEILAARLDDESFEIVDRLLAEVNPWDVRRALQDAYGGTAEQREGRRQVREIVATP